MGGRINNRNEERKGEREMGGRNRWMGLTVGKRWLNSTKKERKGDERS